MSEDTSMPGNPSSSITTGEPSSPSEPSPSSEPRPSSEPSPSSERRPSSEPSPSSERRRGLAAVARPVERSPGLLPRLGLAILHPRWALAIAADRRYAGRSGSDLIAALLLMLAATQLRGLATAVWLGGALDLGLGLRAAIHVLTRALTVDLGLLVVGALVLYALAGSRRNLGRAFDLMCVAALPLLFVELAATVTVQTAGFSAPPVVRWLLSGVSCAWMGALIALAIRPARTAPMRVPAPPREALSPARRAVWVLIAIVVLGVVVQAIWIVENLEQVRPMTTGDEAPGIALPQIDATGQRGPVFTLAATRGKITVIDFWATWCGPCLASMPRLEKLARSHPDVAVITINLDDPAGARALWNERGYTMKLLADDGDVSERYGATTIPHTVIVDRHGMIRKVVRGTGTDIAAVVDALRASD